MKRFFFIIPALILALCLGGCGPGTGDNIGGRFNDSRNTQTINEATITTLTATTLTSTTAGITTATIGTAGVDTTSSKRTLATINGSASDAVFGRSTDKDTGFYFLAATGNRMGFTAKGASVAIFDTAGIAVTGTVSGTTLSGTTVTGAIVNGDSAKIGTVYSKQKTFFIDAATSPLAAHSGSMFIARPLTAKRTITLPGAAAGIWFDILVADTDSLRIVAASGDSILISTGAADRSIGSVAGTCRIIALDAVRWLVTNAIGTWTQDAGES
jgi:hypothetical protein